MSGRRGGMLNCSLVRKRCACGKQVKAVQLTRYGFCDACIKARTQATPAVEQAKAAG